jgi:hypothetical protein
VFVDAVHGKDDAGTNGTEAHPFATVQRAVNASRYRTMQQQSATIVLRQGTHRVSAVIELFPRDKNLTFQAYSGEEVWLSGAKELKVSE